MAEGPQLDYRLLGPLEVWAGDAQRTASQAKQRALLALLLLDLNHPVSTDRLIELLWPGKPPGRPQTAIQGYVSGLRKRLGQTMIETTGAGYVLHAEAEQLDVNRFERLLREGRDALAAGRVEQAACKLSDALQLWRGPALADFTYEAWAQQEIARLEELRTVAREEQIEAQLALGRHRELVSDLDGFINEHPLRERPRGQLMLALYRSGRQAEALSVYQQARERLVEDLGIDPSAELQALHKRILNQDATLQPEPPRAATPTNLLSPLNALIGRKRQLQELQALLRREDVRLVTLTGPGGTGKTRLALAVGFELVDEFPNGVFFVGLAPLVDPGLVAPTIAQVLGVKERGTELLELLCQHLADKEVLLLVDNCEHLLEAVALLSELLAAAPKMTVLATSRERLHLTGEHEFPVAPLAEEESLELFAARAAAAEPNFVLDGNREDVAEICHRLDRLPLAIELAAARMRLLSPQLLLTRLEQSLPLLTGGASDVPEHQRTLRATIAWSYELLEPDEQELFARLAVFAGGCTLEAAEEVCEVELDKLSSLLDKSLIRRRGDRFLMLQTIREYAFERLEESGAEKKIRRRHASYFAALAHAADGPIRGGPDPGWLHIVEEEDDNFRAALAWAEENADRNLLPNLADALSYSWFLRGQLSEGRGWLDAALALVGRERTRQVARMLTEAAALAEHQGDYETAGVYAKQSLQLSREGGETENLIGALNALAGIRSAEGDQERARQLVEEALALARDEQNERWIVLLVGNMGEISLRAGQTEEACVEFREGLRRARAFDFPYGIVWTATGLGSAELLLGRHERARPVLAEALRLAVDSGFREAATDSLETLALFAASRGEIERAARLVGSIELLQVVLGTVVTVPEIHRRLEAILDAGFSAPILERLKAEGRMMDLDEAARYALETLAETGSDAARPQQTARSHE